MARTLIVERDVEMTTRDGITLRADVYRPRTSRLLPVLLQRTPYGKGSASVTFALAAAERGYGVIIQDTRGRGRSEGTYYPFVSEKEDGYDAVEWAARRTWANGLVGMLGGSYLGYTQYAAASLRPRALKAIAPAITFCDPYRAMYAGGTFQLGLAASWVLTSEVLVRAAQLSRDDPARPDALAEAVAAIDGLVQGDTYMHLPVEDMPLIGRGSASPFVADAVNHPTADAYWMRLECPPEALSLPVLHIGGWYDTFAALTLADFTAIGRSGNRLQKVLMGPWIHGAYDSLVGEMDFGVRSSGGLVQPDELHLRWFDRWLKGIMNGIEEEPAIAVFCMGSNEWRHLDQWPPADVRPIPFFLHSGGGANTLHGDGSLARQAPTDQPSDTFVYDPRRPVPTRGGGLCCYAAALPAGAFDQREIETRADVLVYTSPPLEHDLEVLGPLEFHLWATSTARDTDFTAKLVDVSPGGYARNLQDGIIRARFRDGTGGAGPMEPNRPYGFVIDLGVTANVFRAGHCIRLEVSSSNFPRFDRNPNTGACIAGEIILRPAVQTVLHDAEHPSHLVLPIVGRE